MHQCGNKPFQCSCVDAIPPTSTFNGDAQCLPLYRYTADGERVDNITDWALARFRQHYQSCDSRIEKTTFSTMSTLFCTILPIARNTRSISSASSRAFPSMMTLKWAEWGRQLMDLHLNYEQVEPYKLTREDKDPQSTRKAVVPRLIARKEAGEIEIDTLTTLRGVPPEAWEYRLGTYYGSRMDPRTLQGAQAERPHHPREIQHLSLRGLQGARHRSAAPRLHGERRDDEDHPPNA